MLRKMVLICFSLVLLEQIASAASSETPSKDGEEQKVVKIGGKYLVKSITRDEKNSFFTIQFKSETPTGKFDELTLECDHVHFALKEGVVLKIAADVYKVDGNTAELSQVLLFLPHIQGYSPVWLVSRHSGVGSFAAGKFLEMHAPQSDYLVL